jgi:hypothetical protein
VPAVSDAKYMTNAGWDDVPHLDERTKKDLLDSTPPFLRDARSKGIPSLGAGAIYPVEESVFLCDPFLIPAYWPKGYGLDVGWNRTAAVWGAHDRDTDTVYLYAEHYRGQAEPSIHAAGIKARGEWIPGVIDPAAKGRSQKDGEQLIINYRELGLDLAPAINSVEAGIYAVWERLSVGKLKVFRTLKQLAGRAPLLPTRRKGRDRQEERPPHGRHPILHPVGTEARQGPPDRQEHDDAARRRRHWNGILTWRRSRARKCSKPPTTRRRPSSSRGRSCKPPSRASLPG